MSKTPEYSTQPADDVPNHLKKHFLNCLMQTLLVKKFGAELYDSYVIHKNNAILEGGEEVQLPEIETMLAEFETCHNLYELTTAARANGLTINEDDIQSAKVGAQQLYEDEEGNPEET